MVYSPVLVCYSFGVTLLLLLPAVVRLVHTPYTRASRLLSLLLVRILVVTLPLVPRVIGPCVVVGSVSHLYPSLTTVSTFLVSSPFRWLPLRHHPTGLVTSSLFRTMSIFFSISPLLVMPPCWVLLMRLSPHRSLCLPVTLVSGPLWLPVVRR